MVQIHECSLNRMIGDPINIFSSEVRGNLFNVLTLHLLHVKIKDTRGSPNPLVPRNATLMFRSTKQRVQMKLTVGRISFLKVEESER